jgi:hypothetical protein
VLDGELGHRQTVRRANAHSRIMVALHEAAHAAVAYSYVPWGQIVLPFATPFQANARNSCLTPDYEATVFFAGCAMDRTTIEHALFAQGDFYKGYQVLVNTYGHDGAAIKAPVLMDRAERDVLKFLPNIQALAVAAIPKAVLAFSDFDKAAERAGLEKRHMGPVKSAEVVAYLAQFAATPEQLRRDLGRETLITAFIELKIAWNGMMDKREIRIPACEGVPGPWTCGCGRPLLDEATVYAALVDGWPKVPGLLW